LDTQAQSTYASASAIFPAGDPLGIRGAPEPNPQVYFQEIIYCKKIFVLFIELNFLKKF
jgi:hypothetical protein